MFYTTIMCAPRVRKGFVSGRYDISTHCGTRLSPVVTVFGLSIPFLFGGAYITERIFNWPGMGSLGIQAIYSREYPILMGLNLFTSTLVLLGNLIADVLYAAVDPRIRY